MLFTYIRMKVLTFNPNGIFSKQTVPCDLSLVTQRKRKENSSKRCWLLPWKVSFAKWRWSKRHYLVGVNTSAVSVPGMPEGQCMSGLTTRGCSRWRHFGGVHTCVREYLDRLTKGSCCLPQRVGAVWIGSVRVWSLVTCLQCNAAAQREWRKCPWPCSPASLHVHHASIVITFLQMASTQLPGWEKMAIFISVLKRKAYILTFKKWNIVTSSDI